MSEKMKLNNRVPVGFVGVGNMGGALAKRILRASIPLVVFDTNKSLLESFRAAGAEVAVSPAGVASRAQLVFACLPSPAVSKAVAFGDGGIVEGSQVKVYVEMSTIGTNAIAQIASKLSDCGIGLLDAPVSGGPIGAAGGNLTCFTSGTTLNFEYAKSTLEALSDRLFHIGLQPGQAQTLKLANNLLTATNLTVACEAVQLASRNGIDPAKAVEILQVSSGRNRAIEVTFPDQILNKKFAIGAKLSILHKDVELARAEAERLGASNEVALGVLSVLQQALAAGRGEWDMSRIYECVA